MRIAGKTGMRYIDADPTFEIIFIDPNIYPGVAFCVAGTTRIDIARYITCRDIAGVAASDK